jgi:DNA adenine methylase
MGSKYKIGKRIIEAIKNDLKDQSTSEMTWVEPFAGSLGMLFHTGGIFGKRIASDVDEDVITLWQRMQEGYVPPEDVTYEFRKTIKEDQSLFPSELIAFVKYGCSFGGAPWGGFAKPDSRSQNYPAEASRLCRKKIARCMDVDFFHCGYQDLEKIAGTKFNKQTVIYCDPPYANTTGYSKDGFNHQEFWVWCVEMAKRGSIVYVSEYSKPDSVDADLIWEMTRKNALSQKTKVQTEKLYRVK